MCHPGSEADPPTSSGGGRCRRRRGRLPGVINGKPWGDALALARTGRLRQAIQALDEDNPSPLSPDGFVREVLRAVVHFVAHHDAFADALGASLTFAGPANYCPVLVGAVAGARWGAVAISPEMLSDCDVVMRVQGADEILRMAGYETDSERAVRRRIPEAIVWLTNLRGK